MEVKQEGLYPVLYEQRDGGTSSHVDLPHQGVEGLFFSRLLSWLFKGHRPESSSSSGTRGSELTQERAFTLLSENDKLRTDLEASKGEVRELKTQNASLSQELKKIHEICARLQEERKPQAIEAAIRQGCPQNDALTSKEMNVITTQNQHLASMVCDLQRDRTLQLSEITHLDGALRSLGEQLQSTQLDLARVSETLSSNIRLQTNLLIVARSLMEKNTVQQHDKERLNKEISDLAAILRTYSGNTVANRLEAGQLQVEAPQMPPATAPTYCPSTPLKET